MYESFHYGNSYLPKFSYTQISKTCDPFLETPFKMQPHFCQTSHRNAIPSSGTSTGSTPSQLYVVVAYDGNDEKVGTDAEN